MTKSSTDSGRNASAWSGRATASGPVRPRMTAAPPGCESGGTSQASGVAGSKAASLVLPRISARLLGEQPISETRLGSAPRESRA
jgi:hypothetical protein